MPTTTMNHGIATEETIIGLHWTDDGAQVYAAIPVEVLREQLRLHDEVDHSGEQGSALYFYSRPLLRVELNSMVRSARRARDRVYGRDE